MEDSDKSGIDAETVPIVDHSLTDSAPHSLPLPPLSSPSSSSSFLSLPLWYRSPIIRLVCLVCCALLALLNLLSPLVDGRKCDLLKVHQIISAVVYAVFGLLLALAVPVYNTTRSSPSPIIRLLPVLITAVCYVVAVGLVGLSFVSLLVEDRCGQRVFFMFVTTLDTATPLFVCVFLCSYHVLSYVGQYRQKRDEGVDLSPLSPSQSDLHLLYYAFATLLCLINVCAVVLHTEVAAHDTDRRLSWIFLLFQAVLSAGLAVVLVLALLYRLCLTPSNQQRLLLATVSGLSQELLVFVALLLLAWLVSVLVNGVLTLILFVKDVHIGGMAVVGWLNQLTNVLGLCVLVREVLRHWAAVQQFGETAWLRLTNDGMATGIYAHEGRDSWQVHVQPPHADAEVT